MVSIRKNLKLLAFQPTEFLRKVSAHKHAYLGRLASLWQLSWQTEIRDYSKDSHPSAMQFHHSLLADVLHAIKNNHYTDNLDTKEFDIDDKNLVLHQRITSFNWFFIYFRSLYLAHNCLEDDRSKELFKAIIKYRLGGYLCVKIPVSFIDQQKELAEYKKLEKYSDSKLKFSGMFGKLQHYDFEYKGCRYVGDFIYGLEVYFWRNQYFYSKNQVNIAPEAGDTVIDGGACVGDSALVFSNAVGAQGQVYSLDPVDEHLQVLKHNSKQFVHKNVLVMPYGLSDHNVSAKPFKLNQYNPSFSVFMQQKVPLRTLDSLVKKKEIEKIDFIKLDIEGSEMAAIKGAKKSIQRFRPKLAIALYHQPTDLFEIILYIKKRFPFYKLYLDHHTIYNSETVLYCQPE